MAPALAALILTAQGELVAASPGWTTPSSVHDKCGEETGHEATEAIDSDTGTYWHHDATCEHWIEVDLGETKTITKIRLYQSDEFQGGYWGGGPPGGITTTVYVSDDPESWGDSVWSGDMADMQGSDWFESGSFGKDGRYVKLVTSNDSADQRMYEFQAYAETPPPIYPTKPTLYLPSDGDNTVDDNTPYFEWENAENADNHRLVVDNDSDFSSPNENRTIVGDNSYTIADENSLSDDNYSWKVIAINENRENASDVWTFIIDTKVYPTKPSLYLPSNGLTIADSTPYFEWTRGENADNHRLLVWYSENENDYVENRVLITENNYTIADENSLSLDNYSWKVVAANENGENESDVWTFLFDNTFVGYDIVGSAALTITNKIVGSKFSPAIDGQVDNITAYITVTEGDNANVKCAIQDENLNLVSHTDNSSLTSSGWITFTFSSPPRLSANENYWFVAWDNGTVACLNYDAGDENQGLYWVGTYSDNFPDTINPPDGYLNYVFSIYTNLVPSAPPVLPTKPALSSPTDGENISTTETPQFTWSQSENENYYSLLVDSSPPDWKGLSVWITTTDNSYQISTELNDDNYSWKVYAVNDNGRTESDTWTFLISADAHVVTENATNIGSTTATLNATITTYGKYDNVEGRFDYRPYKGLVWAENWYLSDHYYDVPTDPATINDWGNRAPVKYVAASDSSQEDKDAADYQCSGENDENEIQAAINSLTEGGTVYLFDGSYYLNDIGTLPTRHIVVNDDISLIGENKENTFIKENNADSPVRMIHVNGSNILIENITVIGLGRSIDKEASGIQIQIYGAGRDAKNVVIRNVRVENFAAIGIYIERSAWGYPDNVWIINNEVEETGCHGICPAESYNTYVDNNTVTNCGLGTATKYGVTSSIHFVGVENGVIVNNTVENSGGPGIYVGPYIDKKSKNIVVQGNLVVNSGRENDNHAGIVLSGAASKITENIIVSGNKLIDNLSENQKYGVLFYNAYVENCIVDNNNLVMVWEPIIEAGTGHIIENNVGLYLETAWENIIKPTSTFSKGVENLEKNWKYQSRALIRTEDDESEKGDVLILQLVPTPEINNVYMPSTVDVEDNFNAYVEIVHGDNLDRIENIWLKVYRSTKSQEDNDNTINHYTLKYVREGTDNWFEIGPDNTFPYDHLDIDNCSAGQDNLMLDNWTFCIRLASDAESGYWNVWVQVIDNNLNQENQEFQDKFSIRDWQLVETWTGTIEATSQWNLVETWAGTIEAFAKWNLISTWAGNIEGPVAWELVETWTGVLHHLLATVTTESATDVGMTIATLNALVDYGSYPDVDIRFQYRILGAGVWENTAWEKDYTATLYSKGVTGLSSSTTYQFRGHIEFGAFEDFGSIVEFTTQSEAPPTEQWYLKETWTGTIQTEDVVRWRSAESWEGTIMTVAPAEDDGNGGGGGKPDEPEEEEPPSPVLPLSIVGTVWVVGLVMCFLLLSSHPPGFLKRRLARDLSGGILTAAALTFIYITKIQLIVLTPIMMAGGAWALILVIGIIQILSIEPGPKRHRWVKQFMIVLLTLAVLTFGFLHMEGVLP